MIPICMYMYFTESIERLFKIKNIGLLNNIELIKQNEILIYFPWMLAE
jgi:hypothetical protein